MLGLYACVNTVFFNLNVKILIGDLVKVSACDRFIGAFNDAKLHGDRNGGVLVVTRDHNGANACGAALINSGLHLGANGVDHANKTHVTKVAFHSLGLVSLGQCGKLLLGSGKHAKRLVSHLLVCGKDIGADRVGHCHDLAVYKCCGAALEDLIGRTLGKLYKCAVLGLVYRGHHFTHGIKGNLANTHEDIFLLVLAHANLFGVVDKRTLGGLTDRGACLNVKLRVRAKRHCVCKQFFIGADKINYRHLVLGKCTRFVGADDLRAAKCFHSGQLADDGIALRQPV